MLFDFICDGETILSRYNTYVPSVNSEIRLVGNDYVVTAITVDYDLGVVKVQLAQIKN